MIIYRVTLESSFVLHENTSPPSSWELMLKHLFSFENVPFSNKKIFQLILLYLCIFKRNINYTLNSFQQILHSLPDSSII